MGGGAKDSLAVYREIIDVSPVFEKPYIKKRKSELEPCSQLSINKTESIGQSFSGFLTDNHVIYPGHNGMGFKLDDDEIYHDLILVVKSLPLLRDGWVFISAMEALCMYMTDENLENLAKTDMEAAIRAISKIREDAQERRNYTFHDSDEARTISVSENRYGLACTETAALAHNILLFLGMPSKYCIGSLKSTQGGKKVHDSNKHSFVVSKIGDHPVVYDAAQIVNRVPLVVPIDISRLTATGEQTEEDVRVPIGHQYTIPESALVDF